MPYGRLSLGWPVWSSNADSGEGIVAFCDATGCKVVPGVVG